MTQVVIENPVINSPFKEPTRHFRESQTNGTETRVKKIYNGQNSFDSCDNVRLRSLKIAHLEYKTANFPEIYSIISGNSESNFATKVQSSNYSYLLSQHHKVFRRLSANDSNGCI